MPTIVNMETFIIIYTSVYHNSMSDSDSRCYLELHEVFVALETKRLCKFVSLVMVWPGEQYISGAFQAQSSSAYSSSTDEG